MQRRHFLSALLGTLVAGSAAAQTRKKKKSAAPKAPPATLNPANAVATPENSIIDQPVKGATTDNLPPLKALDEPEKWRNFEVVFQFELPEDTDELDIYVPLPCDFLPLYQRQKRLFWQGQAAVELLKFPQNRADLLKINTPSRGFFLRTTRGSVQIKTEVAIAARRFNVGRRSVPPEIEEILRENLKATDLIPNSGAARNLALKIIAHIQDPLAQARALYDWVAETAAFSPQKPFAAGDAQTQILSQSYGGNSADVSALFVALCRAIGIPARNVYGVNIAPSQFSQSLGVSSNWTDNAHAKSEFYVPGYGWIGVDLGSVVKAGGRALAQREELARRFFGFWEPNWLALHWGTLLPSLPVLYAPTAVSNNKARMDVKTQITFRELAR